MDQVNRSINNAFWTTVTPAMIAVAAVVGTLKIKSINKIICKSHSSISSNNNVTVDRIFFFFFFFWLYWLLILLDCWQRSSSLLSFVFFFFIIKLTKQNKIAVNEWDVKKKEKTINYFSIWVFFLKTIFIRFLFQQQQQQPYESPEKKTVFFFLFSLICYWYLVICLDR